MKVNFLFEHTYWVGNLLGGMVFRYVFSPVGAGLNNFEAGLVGANWPRGRKAEKLSHNKFPLV